MCTTAPESPHRANMDQQALTQQIQSMAVALGEKDESIAKLQEELRRAQAGQAPSNNASSDWAKEKSELAAHIRGLEEENKLLRSGSPDEQQKFLRDQNETLRQEATRKIQSLEAEVDRERVRAAVAGGLPDGIVAMTQSEIANAHRKYQSIKEELAQKTRQCEELTARLSTKGAGPTAGLVLDLSDAQIVEQWDQLRDMIRQMTMDLFSQAITTQKMGLTTQEKADFEQLSPHWKSYISEASMVQYFFRAWAWRSLHYRVFHKLGGIWGQQVQESFCSLSDGFRLSAKVELNDHLTWRANTGALLHASCSLDTAGLETISMDIYTAMTKFATGDTGELKKRVQQIVGKGAEFGAVFARSKIVPLISNDINSNATRGFNFHSPLMDLKRKLGNKDVVDMVMTPSLIKYETGWSVLVKAEVVCY